MIFQTERTCLVVALPRSKLPFRQLFDACAVGRDFTLKRTDLQLSHVEIVESWLAMQEMLVFNENGKLDSEP